MRRRQNPPARAPSLARRTGVYYARAADDPQGPHDVTDHRDPPHPAPLRSLWHPLVLVPLLLTAWVYHPVTRAFFFADDFVQLLDIVNEPPLVALLKPFGGQAFLARNLVFLVSYHLFGPDPVRFQWTVLVGHLANVGLLFAVLRAQGASALGACLLATLWGTSPLARGTLGWYAAFGHVLVGGALLLVLLGVARVTRTGGRASLAAVAGCCALLLAGSTCYGPGMGVAFVFPLAAVLLLPALWRQRAQLVTFASLPVVTMAVYVGLRQLYTVVGRPLSAEEIAHQRAAFSGFETIPPLFAHLLAYSGSGTMLSFFMPAGYPHVAAWVAMVVLGLALGVALWRGDGRTRRVALAMVVLWAGVYLMIAGGRAHVYAMYGIQPAAAAMTGRYHYAGTIPLVCLLGLVLQQVGRLPGLRALPRAIVVAVALGVWTVGYRRADFVIDDRPFTRGYVLDTYRDVLARAAAVPAGSTLYVDNEPSPTSVLGPVVPNRLFPGPAAVFFVFHPSSQVDGREVRFIEPDARVRREYDGPGGTPFGALLVAPEDVPAR